MKFNIFYNDIEPIELHAILDVCSALLYVQVLRPQYRKNCFQRQPGVSLTR